VLSWSMTLPSVYQTSSTYSPSDLIPWSRDSFANLARWLADARALASPHLVTVLVGNKSDREDDREVDWAEASRWAAEHGVFRLWSF
jgi:GTPase SAR1 family protein